MVIVITVLRAFDKDRCWGHLEEQLINSINNISSLQLSKQKGFAKFLLARVCNSFFIPSNLPFKTTLLVFVQALSCLLLFVTPWTAAQQAPLSSTISWSLLRLMSIESVMSTNHLILCHPHLLLPSIFPSIRVFSNELALHIMWPDYWSFSFSISPSNEYSGLISFGIDWLDFFAVQGTLKTLLQPHDLTVSDWHTVYMKHGA